MTTDNKYPSNDALTIAHDVIMAGIISTLPAEQTAAIKDFALSRLNTRLDLERSKSEPNNFILQMLNDSINCVNKLV
ncbi:TPA: hypothetical protein MC588_003356 [Citrobacter amalonaticus]|nr:hypothetical protein [Citrobacter amalonaticus]